MFFASLLRQKWVSVITRVEIQHFTFWQLSCRKFKEEMVWHTGSVLVWNVLLAEESLKMCKKAAQEFRQDFVLWSFSFGLPATFGLGCLASLVESILIPNPRWFQMVPSANTDSKEQEQHKNPYDICRAQPFIISWS